MIDSSKHTKTFLESRSKFQCYYNNVGYCKYREKCHYQHFTKICELRLCRDTFCKFRHPRTCKHGAKCRFLQRQCCLYNHKTSDPNKIEESATLEKEVKELKSDVSTLTKVLEDKEQKLQELSKMIANQNTSLAAPGALANRLQRRTSRKANEANLDPPNQKSEITSL